MPLEVVAVPALADNYVFLVVDPDAGVAAVVDPGEYWPVAAALTERGLRLAAVWCTHHHVDHVAAVPDLLAAMDPVPVHAAAADRGRVPCQTVEHRDGDAFAFGGEEVRVWHIPGHTRGHLAYLVGDRVFVGDALFGAGCGRLFEGTAAEMQASLARLRALPDATRVYCGHEYTLHNLRFAVTVEAGNQELARRLAAVASRPDEPTVPLHLGEEKRTNPFLRWDQPGGLPFAEVRQRKDAWRG